MNIKQYAILIVFFIFLVNTAAAPAIEMNYVSITVTPGEELSQKLSFSGAYRRLFATADASGSASLWVTPRRIDYGAIDPGEIIERDYTINVPRSQKPGNYELKWKYSCRYTDGTTCTVASDTVVRIAVEAQPSQTSSGRDKKSLTIRQGEELKDYLSFSARSDEYGLYTWADASGSAASWVTPRHIDFGVIQPGDSTDKYYTISAPQNQRPGNYELVWTWGCGYRSGESCKPVTGVTVLQITVDVKSRPVYTPVSANSDDATMIGVIFILIIFIISFVVWIYILIWVFRDANKRGKSGTFWGLLTFFLGILGLIIYLLARPGGDLVLCNSCGKQKLETLILCPHCRSPQITGFRPASAPMTAPLPVSAPHPDSFTKPEVAIDELKKQKEKLNKINALLDKLDERLAQGEITEVRYSELHEQYEEEAEKLKSQITEKELMKEVGL
jgi:methionine-rich copper-binding protein CopC